MVGYPCSCCGYLTRSISDHGTFEICPVCFWEDDDAQFDDPTFSGGANDVSLQQAKINYLKDGACSPKFKNEVREPFDTEIPSQDAES